MMSVQSSQNSRLQPTARLRLAAAETQGRSTGRRPVRCQHEADQWKVVDGKIELPPGALAEGEPVAVLAMDDSDAVVLSEEDRADLADRAQAIARGEYVDGDEFLKQLKARRPA